MVHLLPAPSGAWELHGAGRQVGLQIPHQNHPEEVTTPSAPNQGKVITFPTAQEAQPGESAGGGGSTLSS